MAMIHVDRARRIDYKCARCEKLDTYKVFEDEAIPPVINCFSCHAGYKMETLQMLESHMGMFPVLPRPSATIKSAN